MTYNNIDEARQAVADAQIKRASDMRLTLSDAERMLEDARQAVIAAGGQVSRAMINRSISLDDATVNSLRAYGHGNLSRGIRKSAATLRLIGEVS